MKKQGRVKHEAKDTPSLSELLWKHYGVSLHALEASATNLKKFNNEIATEKHETVDWLSKDALTKAGILINPHIHWAIRERVGRAVAANHGEPLKLDQEYGHLADGYKFDVPRTNRNIILDILAYFVSPVQHKVATELGIGLMALDYGEVSPIVRPPRPHDNRFPYQLAELKRKACNHVAFQRAGLALTHEAAISKVASAFSCDDETVKSWWTKLSKISPKYDWILAPAELMASIQKHALAPSEGGKPDKWQFLWDEYSDAKLEELGKRYKEIRLRKK